MFVGLLVPLPLEVLLFELLFAMLPPAVAVWLLVTVLLVVPPVTLLFWVVLPPLLVAVAEFDEEALAPATWTLVASGSPAAPTPPELTGPIGPPVAVSDGLAVLVTVPGPPGLR